MNDAFNGLVWEDDASIAWIVRSKTVTVDKKGSTVFFVKELDHAAPNYDDLINTIVQHIKLPE